MIDLTGQVALVPGASGGIGSAVATVLAECGAHVVLGYNSNSARVEEIAEAGGKRDARRMLVKKVDASDPEDIGYWVRGAFEEFGKIDILANCVGWHGNTSFVSFVEQDVEAWYHLIDVELMACIHFARAVLPHMLAANYGRIVTVGSDSSKVGESGAAVSAAARGGNNAFSKSLAREVGRFGITVNTVCPGPTETPVLSSIAGSSEKGRKMVEKMISLNALKRVGEPREVANVVAFLAS